MTLEWYLVKSVFLGLSFIIALLRRLGRHFRLAVLSPFREILIPQIHCVSVYVCDPLEGRTPLSYYCQLDFFRRCGGNTTAVENA